ncbi:hypothetical protein MUB23_15880 [Cuneatibacter sp. NSJ-177]|uniref:hypothetical protein n=1 Tax=Cuneatibacter sp. NSJ-177 TaxID=2931401 RepID=UPI001FD2E1C7|nr:hypothetical protein [Cuneatibacter sp. NSJ-177]MCJ7836864.1 hypothetical protein [Cuneatibacter sp. NSJ-177]
MKKNDNLVIACMCFGMILGIAIGWVVGHSQGKTGITMCFGLVFGMIAGAGVGMVVKKIREKS